MDNSQDKVLGGYIKIRYSLKPCTPESDSEEPNNDNNGGNNVGTSTNGRPEIANGRSEADDAHPSRFFMTKNYPFYLKAADYAREIVLNYGRFCGIKFCRDPCSIPRQVSVFNENGSQVAETLQVDSTEEILVIPVVEGRNSDTSAASPPLTDPNDANTDETEKMGHDLDEDDEKTGPKPGFHGEDQRGANQKNRVSKGVKRPKNNLGNPDGVNSKIKPQEKFHGNEDNNNPSRKKCYKSTSDYFPESYSFSESDGDTDDWLPRKDKELKAKEQIFTCSRIARRGRRGRGMRFKARTVRGRANSKPKAVRVPTASCSDCTGGPGHKRTEPLIQKSRTESEEEKEEERELFEAINAYCECRVSDLKKILNSIQFSDKYAAFIYFLVNKAEKINDSASSGSSWSLPTTRHKSAGDGHQKTMLDALEAYSNKQFELFYQILEKGQFPQKYHQVLRDLWYDAHYQQLGNSLPLAKFRTRKRYPPPGTITDGN